MLYCYVAWRAAFIANLTLLITKQKDFVKIITGANYDQHFNPLFKLLRILKLTDIHISESLIYVYNQLLSNNSIVTFEPAS